MTAVAANRFAVHALPRDVASYVHEYGRDPIWGHAASTQLANGFGPCRLCLRTFREGEEMRVLFTYDSYAGVSEFPQPGPVYIHADECGRYDVNTACGGPDSYASITSACRYGFDVIRVMCGGAPDT